MKKTSNLICGKTINDWTLISQESSAHWLCRCKCGSEKKVNKYTLIHGQSKRCRKCSSQEMERSNFAKDLSGKNYFDWKVISRADGDFDEPFWNCRCKCGCEKIVRGAALKSGKSTRCRSCSSKELKNSKYKLTGKKFGKWTIQKRTLNKNGHAYWTCICECGRSFDVSAQTLLEGRSVCCVKCMPRVGNITHGLTKGGKSKLYGVWRGIKDRCLNPNCKNFKNYGERGIKICDRWKNSFPNFLHDIGEKPFKEASIDRIDNDGNYEPGNVRWADKKTQSGNTRKQKYGVCVTQWSKNKNLNRFHVAKLLKSGYDLSYIEDNVTNPYKEY